MEDGKESLRAKLSRLFDKRDEAGIKIEAALRNAHSAKARRDGIAAEIKKKKEARGKLADEARRAAEKLRQAYTKTQELEPTGQSAKLRSELEKLEWAFQTHAGSYAEEMRMWRDMGRLDSLIKKALEQESVLNEQRTLLSRLESIRNVHNQKHAEVIALSKNWEKENAEMQGFLSQAGELRKELGLLGEKAGAIRMELDGIRSKENAEMAEERAERAKAMQTAKAEEQELLNTKAKEAAEKLKAGKKLTGDDLFILQRAGLLKD